MDKIRFNLVGLRRYYYNLRKELIKQFYDDPFACESFLVGEHYFTIKNYQERRYWSVSLSENINYDDQIILHNMEAKKKKKVKWPFLDQSTF